VFTFTLIRRTGDHTQKVYRIRPAFLEENIGLGLEDFRDPVTFAATGTGLAAVSPLTFPRGRYRPYGAELEDPALELELETAAEGPAGEKAAKLRRPFDAIHFLLTAARPSVGVPQTGALLPPMPARTTEAPKSSAVA
jgi:hypothetical protein